MVKSKTLIEKQARKKTNPELVETLMKGKKNEKWLEVVSIMSGPRKNLVNMNLENISNEVKEGEKIVVPGKVLSKGNIDKKIKIVALNFSENAKEKLLKNGCEVSTILEEIKSNPSAEGLRVLKK